MQRVDPNNIIAALPSVSGEIMRHAWRRRVFALHDREASRLASALDRVHELAQHRPMLAQLAACLRSAPASFHESITAAPTWESLQALIASRDTMCAAAAMLHILRPRSGWSDASLRAETFDRLLVEGFDFAAQALGQKDALSLFVRGSLAHGVVSNRSDVDFEVSGRQAPKGHSAIETWLVELLASLDFEGEGSRGRPTHDDLHGARGLTRDLHEWSELRKAGSARRDVGWLLDPFADVEPGFWRRRSQYECIGRQRTPKYVFFEVRALLTRLAFLSGVGWATSVEQLRCLRTRLGDRAVDDLERCARLALELYEADVSERERLEPLRKRLDAWRSVLRLTGPAKLTVPGPDTRNAAMPAVL